MMIQHQNIPINDPMPELAPTARRILEAALGLLDREGFRALTFENIARESDENKSSIRYHFGSKAGLISALIDVVFYSDASELVHTLPAVSSADERRQLLYEKRRGVSTNLVQSRRLYELLPVILGDPDLGSKLRDVLRWYRALDLWVLAGGGEDHGRTAELEPLAALSAAVLEGTALQYAADPDIDVEPALRLWDQLVVRYLLDVPEEHATGS